MQARRKEERTSDSPKVKLLRSSIRAYHGDAEEKVRRSLLVILDWSGAGHFCRSCEILGSSFTVANVLSCSLDAVLVPSCILVLQCGARILAIFDFLILLYLGRRTLGSNDVASYNRVEIN